MAPHTPELARQALRSHLINGRTSRKGQHLENETLETQPNHHFPVIFVAAVLWFPCHKTIYEMSSSKDGDITCPSGVRLHLSYSSLATRASNCSPGDDAHCGDGRVRVRPFS